MSVLLLCTGSFCHKFLGNKALFDSDYIMTRELYCSLSPAANLHYTILATHVSHSISFLENNIGKQYLIFNEVGSDQDSGSAV